MYTSTENAKIKSAGKQVFTYKPRLAADTWLINRSAQYIPNYLQTCIPMCS